jgi:hypothetical protein
MEDEINLVAIAPRSQIRNYGRAQHSMPVRNRLNICYLVAVLLAACTQALRAGPDLGAYVDSYTARLSARDHFNSNGQRLLSAAAIIRQDRANFYVYSIRDPEDEADSFFSRKINREGLEQLLEHGATTSEAIARVVNGTPLVRTDIFERGITVTIVSD